jgi:exopolyphosphatase/guanosine-5'-triphosphate,3'-diphosphate pyrophosphatase
VQAVATSALRDAKNADFIVKKIEELTKIKVKVITGVEEATLLYKIIMSSIPIMTGKTFLIDIGGGSTELSVINKGVLERVQSFNVGTIRVLKGLPNELADLIQAVQFHSQGEKINIIGTGGSLKRLGKLRKKIFSRMDASIIHKNEIFEMHKYLKNMTALHIMKKFDIKLDRAEVVLPSLEILKGTIEDLNVDIINLPKIGLSDSLLLDMALLKRN